MGSRKRGVCFALAACLFVACGSDGDDVPLDVEGLWAWTIMNFGCTVPPGILTEAQEFLMDQSGDAVTASFTDSQGNTCTISATYRNGVLDGLLTIRTPQNRIIECDLRLLGLIDGAGVVMLDGPVEIMADSDGQCVAAVAETWMMEEEVEPEPVFTECPPVDLVFLMDTSGSMDDEADALCEQLEGVLARLEALGLEDTRVFRWGISEDADAPEHVEDGNFTCLEDNPRDIFPGAVVPGSNPPRMIESTENEGDEDWGPATAIVAHFGSQGRNPTFQWREGAIKIIVPISDEDPSLGDNRPQENDDEDATQQIDLAIAACIDNGVIVSPLIGNDAEVITAELGRKLAEQTGGIAFRTTDPELDIGQLIFDIVFVACGGTLPPPPQPGDAGPTELVAISGEGVLYGFNRQTGEDTALGSTTVDLGEGSGPLNNVNSMIFNERIGVLFAFRDDEEVQIPNTDESMFVPSFCASIAGSGATTLIGEVNGPFLGAAQRRSNLDIFTIDQDDDISFVNNETCVSTDYSDDIDSIAEEGNALTFVGNNLYLASGTVLWMLDTFSGNPTFVTGLSISSDGEPTSDGFEVVSMTTWPADNTVYVLVRDLQSGNTSIGTLNIQSGGIDVLRETSTPMDGLCWVPAGYFSSLNVPD
ncbi:MAG: hypothetical protein AAGD14_18170 [Planctomycetota bacterium]